MARKKKKPVIDRFLLDTYTGTSKHGLVFTNGCDAEDLQPVDADETWKIIDEEIPEGAVVCLGEHAECFPAIEKSVGATVNALYALKGKGLHYHIRTRSEHILDYVDDLDKKLAHIEIVISSFKDGENAAVGCDKDNRPSMCLLALDKLWRQGFDVSLHLDPFVPGMVRKSEIQGIWTDLILTYPEVIEEFGEYPELKSKLGAMNANLKRVDNRYELLPGAMTEWPLIMADWGSFRNVFVEKGDVLILAKEPEEEPVQETDEEQEAVGEA